MPKRLTNSEALSFQNGSARKHSYAVRREYDAERTARGVPMRCDIAGCHFQTEPLVWNGKPLDLILDHVQGNPDENKYEYLRLVCPNCDSQLETRGGRNIGRVTGKTATGYTARHTNEKGVEVLDMHIEPPTGSIQAEGVAPTMTIKPPIPG